eukprot:3111962-Rhodomonas_salina.2
MYRCILVTERLIDAIGLEVFMHVAILHGCPESKTYVPAILKSILQRSDPLSAHLTVMATIEQAGKLNRCQQGKCHSAYAGR